MLEVIKTTKKNLYKKVENGLTNNFLKKNRTRWKLFL